MCHRTFLSSTDLELAFSSLLGHSLAQHGGGRVVSASGSETSVSGLTPASAIIYDAHRLLLYKKKKKKKKKRKKKKFVVASAFVKLHTFLFDFSLCKEKSFSIITFIQLKFAALMVLGCSIVVIVDDLQQGEEAVLFVVNLRQITGNRINCISATEQSN